MNDVNSTPRSSRRRPASIIFDMDGVLIDSTPMHERAWLHYLEAARLPVPPGGVRSLFGIRGIEAIARLHDVDVDSATAEQELSTLDAEVARLFDEGGIPVAPGARQLLIDLRSEGRRIAVGTSALAHVAERSLAELADLIDVVVAAEQVERGKPDPEVYLLAASRLGSAASDCIVVEDAPAGVRAARAAGMRVIGVRGTAGDDALLNAGADGIIDQVADLRQELTKSRP